MGELGKPLIVIGVILAILVIAAMLNTAGIGTAISVWMSKSAIDSTMRDWFILVVILIIFRGGK